MAISLYSKLKPIQYSLWFQIEIFNSLPSAVLWIMTQIGKKSIFSLWIELQIGAKKLDKFIDSVLICDKFQNLTDNLC